jgi:hypothetical protein
MRICFISTMAQVKQNVLGYWGRTIKGGSAVY